MNDLFDVLELCLQELENGTELEVVLSRYPDFADELRPLLTAAMSAQKLASPEPSAEVVKRNRARVLQRAAQKREWESTSDRRFTSFQGRWAVAFVLLVVMLFSTLNVFQASALALPGDGLYPFKRWVEKVRLSFASAGSEYDMLASAIEDERLTEIEKLFDLGISTHVDFAGVVTSQRGDAWRVAEIPVFVTAQTEFPDGLIQVGNAVRVYGVTRGQLVIAEKIELLPVNSALPGIVPVFETTLTATPVLSATPEMIVTLVPSATLTATPTPTPTVTPMVPGNTNDNENSNTNSNTNDDNSNDNGDDDNSGSSGSNNNDDDDGNDNGDDD